MALGMVCLAFGDFHPGSRCLRIFPAAPALAYAVAAFMLVAGAASNGAGRCLWAAAAITAYFALVVVILMNGRVWLAHYAEFLPYESIAIKLAITAGGLIVYATSAKIDAALAARLTRVAQLVFGVCLLVFGAAHFVYLNLTAPLVPKWLPPTQEFWAYATGIAHIAAGVAILTGVQARLAAILLTVMFALFSVLVHVPMVLADPSQSLDLERERGQSRADRRRLGRGGLAGAAKARVMAPSGARRATWSQASLTRACGAACPARGRGEGTRE